MPRQQGKSANIEHYIIQGLYRLDLEVPDAIAGRLAAYITLLDRWNQIYNLTAVRSPEEMVIRHILDSLSILSWLQGPRILDVGSGAGLPGIPLAITRPEFVFYLVDSSGKRTRFMIQAVSQLGLANVNVVHCRIEDYDPGFMFDSILSRAFASVATLLQDAGRLCRPTGCFLAMKGPWPEQELTDLPPGYNVVGIYPLKVPDLDAKRHLIHLRPVCSPRA